MKDEVKKFLGRFKGPFGIEIDSYDMWIQDATERKVPVSKGIFCYLLNLYPLFERLVEAVDELYEVAELRGDNTLPLPEDDPQLWTARMQTAWNEAQSALDALHEAGFGEEMSNA